VFLQSVSHEELHAVITTNINQATLPTDHIGDMVKGWVMVILTFGFVALYGLALIGKLKPLADVSMISRIEPIIFVIIGYYFGRLPAQQNEKSLKDEIGRQTQKADAAQHAKENALQSREAIEEKLKNVDAALGLTSTSRVDSSLQAESGNSGEVALRHSVAAARRILGR
jgi:hypothetical protein